MNTVTEENRIHLFSNIQTDYKDRTNTLIKSYELSIIIVNTFI